MKFEIKHRYSGEIMFSCETDSWRLAIELAVKSKANLSWADLRSADLSWAYLRSADLSSADLSSANLSWANLSWANLSWANLSWADLRSADLSSANLSSADLSSANLRSANLRSANLIYFAHNKQCAYFTFDGKIRIGCEYHEISKWLAEYKAIGKKVNYTDLEIQTYGVFIKLCSKLQAGHDKKLALEKKGTRE